MIPALAAAACLAGAVGDTHKAEVGVALTADPAGAHRREVWRAWDERGRTGHWGAILKVGPTIRAARLEDFAPYRRPAQLEEKRERVGNGLYATRLIDPEDEHSPVATAS